MGLQQIQGSRKPSPEMSRPPDLTWGIQDRIERLHIHSAWCQTIPLAVREAPDWLGHPELLVPEVSVCVFRRAAISWSDEKGCGLGESP